MKINQRNVFGDNIIYNISPGSSRELNDDQKKEILNILNTLKVNSIVIRFEDGGETRQFVENIANFLIENNYKVRFISGLMLEMTRYEFSIRKHPSDPNFAIFSIGSII